MREQSLNFLQTLVNTPSPVGHEVRGQRVWLDYAKSYADETFSDAYGNCVAVLNKGGSPRLMLAAHADEIAMAVNYITDDGYIYVRKIGRIDAAITKAQRVVIHARDGRSEEHTSELQSPCNLVCRLLLEKKKNTTDTRGAVTLAA